MGKKYLSFTRAALTRYTPTVSVASPGSIHRGKERQRLHQAKNIQLPSSEIFLHGTIDN